MDQNTPNTNPQTPAAAPQVVPVGVKSSVAAGLLGIFLGQFGAHDWYLGDKKKGIIHLALLGGGFVLIILSAIMTALTAIRVPFLAFFFGALMFLAYIAIIGNGIWGLVEGIIILAQGDAGLAAKGYTVAAPVAYAQPAQPAQPAPAAAPATTTTTEEVKETSEETEHKSDEHKSDAPEHKEEHQEEVKETSAE